MKIVSILSLCHHIIKSSKSISLSQNTHSYYATKSLTLLCRHKICSFRGMNPCCRLLLDCENIHSCKYVGQVASAELCLSRWQAWSTGMVGPICGDRRCVNRLVSSIVNGVNALKKWYLRNKGSIRAKHCNSVLTLRGTTVFPISKSKDSLCTLFSIIFPTTI